MSLLAAVLSSGIAAMSVDLAAPAGGALATALASAGLLGMGLSDWIWGGSDDADEDDADGGDEMDDLLGGDDALDDLGGGDGPAAEGEDPLDDEFDDGADLGGDFDDDFGGEPSGGDTSELKDRLDDVEDDLEALSRSMESLQEDNEAISESVEEVEETVTKLLEIYEVVTQGVNPFNEDVPEGEAPEEGFGLFDDRDDHAEPAGEAVADDDALDLFDVEEAEADEAAESDDGVTFDELKAEYDEEEADWDKEPESVDDPLDVEADDPEDVEPVEPDEPSIDEADTEGAADEPATVEEPEEGPYLDALPDGYVQELVVLEWLGSLLDRGGVRDARHALQYYEELGWLGDEAVRELETAMVGLQDGADPTATATDGGRPAGLSQRDHVESLEYIAQLAGGSTDWGAPAGLQGSP